MGDTDEESDAFSDDDSLFFSDNEEEKTEDKDKTFVLSRMNKTAQLGVSFGVSMIQANNIVIIILLSVVSLIFSLTVLKIGLPIHS